MMEICRYTSIIYADYCFFSKVGTLSRSGHIIQGGCTCTFSPLPHPPPPAMPPLPFPSFMDEVFGEERVKKDN